MKESTDNYAVWEEVDEETFVRFTQYLYTGDYIAAEATSFPDTADGDKEQPGAATKPTTVVLATTGPYDNPKLSWIQEKALDSFKALSYPAKPAAPVTIKDNSDPSKGFAPVLLSHAKLFVVADCYGIEPLMQLTLHKLHKQLCHFKVHRRRVLDIVQLVEYSYDHGPGKLQELTALFASCHLTTLWRSEEFKSLFQEHAHLSKSLMDSLMKNVYKPRDYTRRSYN